VAVVPADNYSDEHEQLGPRALDLNNAGVEQRTQYWVAFSYFAPHHCGKQNAQVIAYIKGKSVGMSIICFGFS